MVVMAGVFFTFRRTRVAGIGARSTQRLHQRSATRHRTQRRSTCIRAIAVGTDAGAHIHVFIKAGVAAYFACNETLCTRLDARFIRALLRRQIFSEFDRRH